MSGVRQRWNFILGPLAKEANIILKGWGRR